MRGTKIFAPRNSDASPFKNLNRFVVRDTRKRPTNRFQLGKISFEDFQLWSSPRKNGLNNVLNELLSKKHILIQISKSDFRLNHPKLGQMFSSFGFFSTKSRAKNIDLTEGHCTHFTIKLPGLG